MANVFRLAIVIPCHRRVDLLRVCLRSVLQYAPAETEILVVDDASPQRIVSDLALSFAGVRVLRLEKQSGYCVAVNQGIAHTSAPIVEVLNDDTEVTSPWADAALQCFADAKVAAVAPLVLLGTPNNHPKIDSAGDSYDLGGYARKRGHGQALTEQWLQPASVFGASGSSAFYRRSVLQQVGLFPEEFGAYFEDVDLSFRIQRAGYKVQYEPRSQLWHCCGSSYGRTNRRLLEQQSRNEERVFWRNVPKRDLWTALPRHLAVLAGKTMLRMREGTLIPFLLGRLRLLTEARSIYRHRCQLEALMIKPGHPADR